MRAVYFVTTGQRTFELNKRIDKEHRLIFHGVSRYPGETETGWSRTRLLTDSIRDLTHVSRSGTFVPPIFAPWSCQVVMSEALRSKCSTLNGIEFHPVVFERLVRLDLPGLGEDTDSGLMTREMMRDRIAEMPDCPDLHATVGRYYLLLAPRIHELSETFADEKLVELEYGRYWDPRSRNAVLSMTLLSKHSIYFTQGNLCMTEQAFEILGPYLDLDYFIVDAYRVDKMLDPVTGRYRDWYETKDGM